MNGFGWIADPVIEALGWALLHFLWQGAAVAILFALGQRSLRNATANTRYLFGCIALILLVLLPVGTTLRLIAIPRDVTFPTGWVSTFPELQNQPGMETGRPVGLSSRNPFRPLVGESVESPIERRTVEFGRFLEVVLPYAVVIWAIGVVLFSLRLFGGWMAFRRLVLRHAQPVASVIQEEATRWIRTLNLRSVSVLQSPRIPVPCLIGWLRPAILFPVSVLTGLSPEQIRAILVHELAHIRRHDYVINWLQTIAETILFYHPATWWISSWIRIEREHCCDDQVVQLTGDPDTYARALFTLETLRDVRRPALAATHGPLLSRIQRLLIPGYRSTPSSIGWIAGMSILGILVLLLLSVQSGVSGKMDTGSDRVDQGIQETESIGIVSEDPGELSLPNALDVADVPVVDRTVKDLPAARYLLIGGESAPPSPDGHRLLVALPGGDGGINFHPFIKRIYKNALSSQYLVAELIAPQWSPDQFETIVWPTSTTPWNGMEFSTEVFIEGVIRDVKANYRIDDRYVFVLGWSSGGPAVYAASLNPDRTATGSFVAMSVFKPERLPPLENARGHSYFLLHSPEDFIPRQMPETARDRLQENGAVVRMLTYPGGHGWHGDVYGNIQQGIQWLESRQNPFHDSRK